MSDQKFASQMEFLQTHADNFAKRANRLDVINGKLNDFEPMLDEIEKLTTEREEILKLNRDEKKFLVTMNEMVLRSTGEPISNGPLFQDHKQI